MEFRAQGRLGCPHDYEVFRTGLEPLLQRIHRADRHVGKSPAPRPCRRRRQAELVELRRQLQAAVEAEATKRPPVYATCSDRRKPRMNLDNLTHTSGEWLRGSGPESDIVISSRIRLARNLAAFPFTNRASSYQKAEIEALLRDRIAKLELDPQARLRQRAEPVHARPPVPRRAPAHQPRAGRRRRAARRRPGAAGDRQPDGQRGGPPAPAGHAQRLHPRRGLAGDRPRRRPARAARQLRLQRGVRLPDRLPHQRRHRHARQRHAAPAGPGASPSRSRRSSAPCRRSTWRCAACTARAAGRPATSTRSPTR